MLTNMIETELSKPNLYENAPILVTGGAGFIGSHLVESLVALGARVTVVDNLRDGHRANLVAAFEAGAQLVEADVRDADAIRKVVREVGPRFVFHLAANASVPGSVQNPAYDFETNGAGTFVLLDALRETGGCQKIVIASSGAVYGEPKSFPIREDDPLLPISPYGASKANSEVSGRMFGRVYGLPVVMARLFNTYGPRMARFVILDFLNKLEANPRHLEILGNGQQVRDFTFVSDTVAGLLLLGEKGQLGEAYNVSSGTSHSVRELAAHLLDELNFEHETQLSFTGQSWVGDAQHWEVSIEKIAELGYQAHVPVSEGLRPTINWWRTQKQLQTRSADQPGRLMTAGTQ